MTTILTILASLFLATAAHGGLLTGAAKIAGKIAGHGADDAAKAVVVHYGDDAAKAVSHYGDDAAKAVAKGGAEAAVRAAPKVAKTVDAAVDAARIEARATKPVVEAVHRAPIVRPTHVAAAGAGVAGVVASHNLTAGEREKDQALADATRNALAEHPELLPEVVRINGERGFWNQIGAGFGRGFVRFGALLGGGFGLAALLRAIPARRRRKPVVVDVTPEPDKQIESAKRQNRQE